LKLVAIGYVAIIGDVDLLNIWELFSGVRANLQQRVAQNEGGAVSNPNKVRPPVALKLGHGLNDASIVVINHSTRK
jgi:hypothetical protein